MPMLALLAEPSVEVMPCSGYPQCVGALSKTHSQRLPNLFYAQDGRGTVKLLGMIPHASVRAVRRP